MGIQYPAINSGVAGTGSTAAMGLNSFRNKIINGDFRLDYIGEKTLNNTGDYFCNRWYAEVNNGEIGAEKNYLLGSNSYNILNNLDPFNDNSGISLWNFDNNVNDLSGNYNGTVSGSVSFDTGKFGNAAVWSGHNSDNYISVPSISLGNYFTISLWCYINTNNTYINAFLGNEKYLTIGRNDYDNGNQYKLLFGLGDGTNWIDSVYGNMTLENSKWYNIIVVRDNKKVSFYINGILDAVRTISSQTFNNTFYFGNRQGQNSDYALDGDLDQIRFFNRILKDNEIYSIYKEEYIQILKKYGQITINSISDNSNFLLKPFVQKFEQQVLQQIEGGNVTLSFNFACSQTGTYRAKFIDFNNNEVSQTFAYNNSNNDFQNISVTFDISGLGDSGEFYLSNEYGGEIQIGVQDNANDTEVIQLGANDWIKVTDVQLEKGDTATDFENRPIQVETALCNRYIAKSSLGADALEFLNMRTTPAISNDILDAEL